MRRITRVFAIIFIAAFPVQAFAWTMMGDIFLGHKAEALTNMQGAPGEVNIMVVNAVIIEEGQVVEDKTDFCLITTLCGVAAKDTTLSDGCTYCGQGWAAQGLTTIPGVPNPFTLRFWGGPATGTEFCETWTNPSRPR